MVWQPTQFSFNYEEIMKIALLFNLFNGLNGMKFLFFFLRNFVFLTIYMWQKRAWFWKVRGTT